MWNVKEGDAGKWKQAAIGEGERGKESQSYGNAIKAGCRRPLLERRMPRKRGTVLYDDHKKSWWWWWWWWQGEGSQNQNQSRSLLSFHCQAQYLGTNVSQFLHNIHGKELLVQGNDDGEKGEREGKWLHHFTIITTLLTYLLSEAYSEYLALLHLFTLVKVFTFLFEFH